MPIDRLTRVNELIKREVAADLFRTVGTPGFDFSAVTVTRVEVTSDLRHAKVYVSIRDHRDDRDKMLRALRKKAHVMQQHLRKRIVMKFIPTLKFYHDGSVETGDRVLDILHRLEEDEGLDIHPGAAAATEPTEDGTRP